MRWLAQFKMQIRMLFQRRQATAHLDDELRFHIDRQIEENLAGGMSAAEARAAALRTFGNPALLRDQARATWSWNWLESLVRDLRYGIRTLGRTPGFALIAISVMALGIGANVALFTVVRGVLLKPLPFDNPSQLVMLYEHESIGGQSFPYNQVAAGVYAEWKKQSHSFRDLAILIGDETDALTSQGGQLPENASGAACSWNLFSLLGVKPMLGRDFTAADDSLEANGTAILSSSLWKRRFGSDPAIVGKTIDINARPVTVIGVMPQWFAFPYATTQLWTPIYHSRPEAIMTVLDMHDFSVVGRLKPGISIAQGAADLSVISRRLHDAHLNDPFIAASASSRPLLEGMVGDIKTPLYVLLAATGCVLLIACLNVANLLVARAAARRKELAIRAALGGGRLRLLRERLMESFLLSAAGGSAGLALAYAAVAWLVHSRKDMARVDSIHVDAVVAAFTVGVIALCALFSGLISAFSAKDRQVLRALSESSRAHSGGQSHTAVRRLLLTLEVALTVVLLTGAGLLLKSYERLRSADLGCITRNVLTMRMVLPSARYNTPASRASFFEALLERVRALPGVEAAGMATALPGQGHWSDWGFTIAEHPPLPQGAGVFAMDRSVDPGYFSALGIPILGGHTFDDGQRTDHANEVIVSESFVRKYFPGEDPLGKHLRTIQWGSATIVGIVGDTRARIGDQPQPIQYYPLLKGDQNTAALVIRSSGDVAQQALPVQHIFAGLDRDLPVSDVLTMDQLLGRSTFDQSFNATLLTAFAALSLLLAGVGLFGVLSYLVAQRTSEIGIRIALGAQREQVLRLMLADGLRPALAGLVLGLVASAAIVRLIRSMLYETQPLDPAVFACVAAALLLVAVLACVAPAWRASRLDPMQALRTE
jgi:putative ABC transport system permease protein